MLTALAGIAALIVLTAATGYFVAQEFAFVAADRAALSQAAGAGDVRSERALKVMARLSFMLSGAQLGITVTALIVGFIAEPAVAYFVEPLVELAGAPAGAAGGVSVAVGFATATVVQMVLGELLPKNLALARAEPLARFLARSTLAYLAVAGPVIMFFDTAAARLLRAFGVEPVEELHHGATLEELGDIIGESQRSGHLPADLSDLLQRALTFGDRTADEAMVPRPDVVTVSVAATGEDLTALVGECGHTDYPVLGEDIDDVVGVAGVRELASAPERPVRAVMRPPLLVPGTLPLQTVVERMRETGEEFACVVDEYGGLAGILTFEDIAEELVGEIIDENDIEQAAPARGEGVWVIDATTRIAQVRDLTGLALPGGTAYDSVSGLIMAELGRLPRPGDRVTVGLDPDYGPPGEVAAEVLTVRRRVARTVRLRVVEREPQ